MEMFERNAWETPFLALSHLVDHGWQVKGMSYIRGNIRGNLIHSGGLWVLITKVISTETPKKMEPIPAFDLSTDFDFAW